jgi:hypothetical protein
MLRPRHYHSALVVCDDEGELGLSQPHPIPRANYLVGHWGVAPPGSFERILDGVIVMTPCCDVDVLVFAGYCSYAKIDCPTAEEPEVESFLVKHFAQALNRLKLFSG